MFVHEGWHLVSLLWPQDDKPLHSWLDLYPGFCSQGPARHLLDVTPHTVLRFPLVKTFVVSQGNLEQASLLLLTACAANRKLVFLKAPARQQKQNYRQQSKRDGARPVILHGESTGRSKPHSYLLHPIISRSFTGTRWLASRD